MSEFQNGNLSPWGYIIDSASLPDFITAQEFNAFTANRFTGDTRATATIPSATESIRNYCGWHIAPNLTCGMVYRVADLRDAFVGSDLIIQLPATFVTSVLKVVINAELNELTGEYEGDEATEFDSNMGSGLIRVYDVSPRSRKSKIFIKYTAGFPTTSIPAIKELTADLVTHAVANPYGVNSESAGGVSVSYSSTWASRAGSTALTNNTREVLDKYKVKGVF